MIERNWSLAIIGIGYAEYIQPLALSLKAAGEALTDVDFYVKNYNTDEADQARETGFTVHEMQTNSMAVMYNCAVNNAKTKYIMLATSDVVFYEDSFVTLNRWLYDNTCDIAFCQPFNMDGTAQFDRTVAMEEGESDRLILRPIYSGDNCGQTELTEFTESCFLVKSTKEKLFCENYISIVFAADFFWEKQLNNTLALQMPCKVKCFQASEHIVANAVDDIADLSKKTLYLRKFIKLEKRFKYLQGEHDKAVSANAQLTEQNNKMIEQNYKKDAEIFNQTNRINELESWEHIYIQRIASLEAIRQSHTWRYAHKLTTVLAKICPAGSIRRKVALFIFKWPVLIKHGLSNTRIQMKKNAQLRKEPIITLPKHEVLKVSIIIPVYNQYAYTHACIKSIFETCADIEYEIILADDNSQDFTKNISEKVKNLVIVRNKENLRFLLNCNNAAKVARGEFIVFLNNDTVVKENWLQSMLDIMENRPDCGMTGSKIVFPDGRLQEAGGIVWKDGTAWNYGRMQDSDASEYNYVKEVDYISGCSIMIRTKLWREIGGFDERFVPAYCEDSDLAFEVRKHGFKVLYQPLSVVVHYEGVTNGTDVQCGQKQYQVANNVKFRKKWETVLRNENFMEGKNVFCARDKSMNKPCVLFIDHYVPTFDQDAGSRTVYEYLRLFVKMGYNVKFIPDNFDCSERYSVELQQMGIEVLYGSYYVQNWKKWIETNEKQIKFVFANRPHITIKYIDFLRKATNARIIYYGHDLHFLRESREYEITHDEKLLNSIEKWKAIELSLMRKADMSYYPSKIEEDFIHKIDSDIRVKAIPAYIFENVKSPQYKAENRKNILFVGGFGHPPNEDAVVWFANEILPTVLKLHPNIHFDVVGSKPTDKVKNLQNESITVHGFVSDEVLAQFYEDCRLTVVPLRYGAGIKGKVVEAMKFGIPVLTTSVGAEGIIGAENILAIDDEPEAFAKHLVSLYDDETTLCSMSLASCEYVRNYFGPENAMNTIREDFT